MSLYFRLLIIVCCQTVIFAEEFCLRSEKLVDYGSYVFTNGAKIVKQEYIVTEISGSNFYVRGFVNGVGWKWGKFTLTNNATITLNKEQYKVITDITSVREVTKKIKKQREDEQLLLKARKIAEEAKLENERLKVAKRPDEIFNMPWGVSLSDLKDKIGNLSKAGNLGRANFPAGWPIEFALGLLIKANEIPLNNNKTIILHNVSSFMSKYSRYLIEGKESRGDYTDFTLLVGSSYQGFYKIIDNKEENDMRAIIDKSIGKSAIPVKRIDTYKEFELGSNEAFFVEGWMWENEQTKIYLARYKDGFNNTSLAVIKISKTLIADIEKVIQNNREVIEGQ